MNILCEYLSNVNRNNKSSKSIFDSVRLLRYFMIKFTQRVDQRQRILTSLSIMRNHILKYYRIYYARKNITNLYNQQVLQTCIINKLTNIFVSKFKLKSIKVSGPN